VVRYSVRDVEQAVVSLKDAGLLHFVHPSHGRSVTRYAQALDEQLRIDVQRLALMAVLLLRGPQTAGELRARTDRMAAFDDSAAVDAELEAMGGAPEPLVLRLPRRPGQKEERWMQLLSPEALGQVDTALEANGYPGATGRLDGAGREVPSDRRPGLAEDPSGMIDAFPASRVSGDERLAALDDEVRALRVEVAELRAAVERLQGGPSA
jgi:hypothetical protein